MSLSNLHLFYVINFLVIFTLLYFFIDFKNIIINKNYARIALDYFLFVKTLIKENTTKRNFIYFGIVLFLFSFIFSSNFSGTIPYTFTVTSHAIITFLLSFSFFISINILSIIKHKIKFLGIFLPGGAPTALIPAIVTIEIISYIARLFSLAIRLFANIMAGHTLLKILCGFCWFILIKFIILKSFLILLIPFILIVVVTTLEFCIAFLQTYVFTVLSCIYINDADTLAH